MVVEGGCAVFVRDCISDASAYTFRIDLLPGLTRVIARKYLEYNRFLARVVEQDELWLYSRSADPE